MTLRCAPDLECMDLQFHRATILFNFSSIFWGVCETCTCVGIGFVHEMFKYINSSTATDYTIYCHCAHHYEFDMLLGCAHCTLCTR